MGWRPSRPETVFVLRVITSYSIHYTKLYDAEAAEARHIGLVTNLSGIFGKQACALFSNQPNPCGYRYEDITAAVAAVDAPCALDGGYVGPATIVGYTVVFERGDSYNFV